MLNYDLLMAVLVVSAFCGSVACFLVYWPRFDRHNRVGANAMAWIVVAVLAFSLGMIRTFFDEHDWYQWARAAIFLLCNIVIYWRLFLLVGARRADLRDEQENQDVGSE